MWDKFIGDRSNLISDLSPIKFRNINKKPATNAKRIACVRFIIAMSFHLIFIKYCKKIGFSSFLCAVFAAFFAVHSTSFWSWKFNYKWTNTKKYKWKISLFNYSYGRAVSGCITFYTNVSLVFSVYRIFTSFIIGI